MFTGAFFGQWSASLTAKCCDTRAQSLRFVRWFRLETAAARCIDGGDFAGAIRNYHEILEVVPNDPYALLMLVKCHTWAGDKRDALEAAKRLESTEPTDFSSLQALACTFANCGEHHSAKPYVERALALADDATVGGTGILWILEAVFTVKAWLFGAADRQRLVDQHNDSIHEWCRWAHGYLSWYAATYSSGSGAVH